MSISAARSLRFLTATQVERLYVSYIADAKPTQPQLLESATDSPINVRHYSNETNVFQLAAILAEKIMKNHAFGDGNKRTGFVAADMFLKTNGYKLQKEPMTDDAKNEILTEAHVAVTVKKWDADRLGKFYESIATEMETSTPMIQQF